MTNSDSLLSGYQALVQNHAFSFDPEITALKQLVEARMQELRSREQALVSAQAIELKRITDALATDARCLLPTPELSAFVQEFKRMSRPWYSQKPESPIADDPTTWLLATLSLPISLSNYQTSVDPNAYDDERTHILYSYSLSLRLGNAERVVEIPYKRTYNLNEHRDFSLKEQIDFYIAGDVDDLLREIKHPEAEINQLTAELSALVGYATSLFALTPRTANFEYTSTQED
ncbi:hypothetical protein H6G81_23195 [Scytonema hofmannii FACHB-248]|uniref:Uncharacterized protein n=1 Tax=Scytonema hofmannii FACHB-248 TaxID=1842502 RepID=A0ABR8GV13_9CYAN|nr:MULTISPECIES: hypothetical protein [Nostocales]MBD2607354.1 hypothetical protein [Scytonema hofmannii FACHB-248]